MSITVDDLFAFLAGPGAREKIALAIAAEKARLACLEALLQAVPAAEAGAPPMVGPGPETAPETGPPPVGDSERPNSPIERNGPMARKGRAVADSTAERLRQAMARLIKAKGPMRPGALAKELGVDSGRMHNLYSRGPRWFILEPDGVHLTAAGYAALEEEDGGAKRVEPNSDIVEEAAP